MSDETDSKVPLQPVSADDQNDNLAGASVLTLLQRSAYMAEGNSQYAVDIAKDLGCVETPGGEATQGRRSWRGALIFRIDTMP
jgi:hypothetical protein